MEVEDEFWTAGEVASSDGDRIATALRHAKLLRRVSKWGAIELSTEGGCGQLEACDSGYILNGGAFGPETVRLISAALIAAGLVHRLEVYDDTGTMITYHHYRWPLPKEA